MNTEHELPISYVKQFTPLVVGDVIIKTKSNYEVLLKGCIDHWNEMDPQDDNWFLVSFASRTNTGRQPVGDDVVVDVILASGNPPSNNERRVAGGFVWSIWKKSSDIKTWKLNHAALLSKYQSEQGAKNMNEFTKENTLDATEYGIAGDMPTFYKSNRGYCMNSFYQYDWAKINGIASAPEFIELSRPFGERKEDHTIDGVVTYAFSYELDHLTKNATHYNTKQRCFFELTEGEYAMVLYIHSHEWAVSSCTTNEKLRTNDKYWKLDANQDKPLHHIDLAAAAGAVDDIVISPEQIIEPWVADHLKGVGAIAPKPAFTPSLGSECEVSFVEWTKCYVCGKTKAGLLVIEVDEATFVVTSALELRPIDNRTDEEKLRDELKIAFNESVKLNNNLISGARFIDVLMDKFTITLKD